MAEKLIKFFGILAGLQFLFTLFLFLAVRNNPPFHAIMGMALGVYIFWIALSGLIMRGFRIPARAFIQKIKMDWRLKFIIFATALALLEETVTVAMTNTAHFYGVTMAAAHITASSNYWDVVLTHSVVLFFPMICIWGWLLSKYDISPNALFIIWGLTGWFMETVYAGFGHWLEIGFWVFVYGLMVYLPAYCCLPEQRQAKKPPAWFYVLAIVGVPFVGAIIGGLLATVIKYFRPPHFFPGVK